jgi:hypothetical protein
MNMDRKDLSISEVTAEIVKETPSISISELVNEAIKRHTEHGCRFFEGAAQRVIANYNSLKLSVLDLIPLVTFLRYEESFCKRDGIDKTLL